MVFAVSLRASHTVCGRRNYPPVGVTGGYCSRIGPDFPALSSPSLLHRLTAPGKYMVRSGTLDREDQYTKDFLDRAAKRTDRGTNGGTVRWMDGLIDGGREGGREGGR